jgi:hypothetical protein
MKRIAGLILLAVALAAAASGCAVQASGSAVPEPLPISMKGYELYSWQNGGQWVFTLMTGTNRLKTLAEITTAPDSESADRLIKVSARGIAELESLLTRLPSKSEIFWMGSGSLKQAGVEPGGLSLPPQDVITVIQERCLRLGLILTVGQ